MSQVTTLDSSSKTLMKKKKLRKKKSKDDDTSSVLQVSIPKVRKSVGRWGPGNKLFIADGWHFCKVAFGVFWCWSKAGLSLCLPSWAFINKTHTLMHIKHIPKRAAAASEGGVKAVLKQYNNYDVWLKCVKTTEWLWILFLQRKLVCFVHFCASTTSPLLIWKAEMNSK